MFVSWDTKGSMPYSVQVDSDGGCEFASSPAIANIIIKHSLLSFYNKT